MYSACFLNSSVTGFRLWISIYCLCKWRVLIFSFTCAFDCITLDSASFFVYFSVVEYRSRADMERAIKQMSQSSLDGRKIFVKEV
jgi:hypothetical protein